MAERIVGRDGLYSCPFCGSTSAPVIQRKNFGTQTTWFVWCDTDDLGCDAQGGERVTEYDARFAWNMGREASS